MKTQHPFLSLARRARQSLLLLTLSGFIGATQAAPSPSELLEQGIYSEETKGDLDSAMQLYQQVVSEAKTGQALAAQAQYRLGVCLYKKKNFTDATAAFEKLVKDYPEQKELVTRANEYLVGAVALLPAPWVDGEELRLDVILPSGFVIGTARYTADADELAGRKIWRLSSYLYAGIQQFSRVEVEADSFKPIHCFWKHTLIGDADTVYTPGKAELKLQGKDEIKTVELEGVLYDNEEVLALMRRLPLTTNYTTTLRVFSGLGGGAVIPIKLDVTALETVTVSAGTFECFKVELSVKQTFWYSADEHRYLVKFEGGGVSAELAKVRQGKPTERASYQDSLVSVTAPTDWLFFAQKTVENDKRLRLLILDPDTSANTVLSAMSLDNLKPEEKTLRACADRAIAEATKSMKNFQVRPDSWTETTLAGRPALSVTADFEEGKETHVAYAIFTLAGNNAFEIHTHANAPEAKSFRSKFETMLQTLQLH
jgi:hypothetical protein